MPSQAASSSLPAHLRLGLSLPGIRQQLEVLPADAVRQSNDCIPRDASGLPKFPPNQQLNGYINQHFISCSSTDSRSLCERLQEQHSPHVGEASIFVSWPLSTAMATLVDALSVFLRQHELPEDTTFFWVCDYVIRQGATTLRADLDRLGDCVEAIGHTCLLLEPWHAPEPLKRAYCIKEVYHTQASNARFDMVMSTEQLHSFEQALVAEFDSIASAVSAVDVRQAECRNAKDKERILGELEAGVGFGRCNEGVIRMLRGTLGSAGHAALSRMQPDERGTSALLPNLAELLRVNGRIDEAEPLLREAFEARTSRLGEKHALSLSATSQLGAFLYEKGQLKEGIRLCRRAHRLSRKALGPRHETTLEALERLSDVLASEGFVDEAVELYGTLVDARRAMLGEQHPKTLEAQAGLGDAKRMAGQQREAEGLLRAVLVGRRAAHGDRHPDTLEAAHRLASLLEQVNCADLP